MSSLFKSITFISNFSKGILLLILCFSQAIFSQNTDLDLVLASDGDTNNWYGNSISMSDDYLVVGAFAVHIPGSDLDGACYIYSKDTDGKWGNEQKLSTPDGELSAMFGYSVSISGNTVVIGAPLHGPPNDLGAAFVFEVDGNGQWNFVQKLTASDDSSNLKFGNKVFISGDYMAVQANYDNFNNIPSRIYLFEKNNAGVWSEVQILDPDVANLVFDFGESLSMYGDYLIAGHVSYGETTQNQGGVHIYKRNGNGIWIKEALLTPSSGIEETGFGESVSIYENTLVVGAPYTIEGENNPGLVYVYELNTSGNWDLNQELFATFSSEYDGFGISVQIHEDQLIVGGFHHEPFLPISGYANTFKRTGSSDWTNEEFYLAFDASPNDHFGRTVCISGNNLAIAATHHDGNGPQAGAVYTTTINCSFELECPEDLVIETNTGTCEGLISYEEAMLIPEIIDGCGDITISQVSGPFNDDILEVGSYEVVYEAISEEGISANCGFAIEVVDNEAPNALCQDLEVQLNPCAEVTILTEDIDFGSTDACGIDSYNLSQTVFDESNIGTNPVELTVIDINGNSSTCNANILINLPISIDESTLIEAENITTSYGDFLDLIPSIDNQEGIIFSWYMNGTLYCDDCYSISISPESNVLVELLVQDAADCFTLSDAVNIQLLVDYSVHIPTAFSPNYDGANDLFQAYFSDGVEPAYELQIRDRWGNVVYHKKGEQIGWDGRFRGKEADTGVYTYNLVFSLVNGEEVVETGDVCLVR